MCLVSSKTVPRRFRTTARLSDSLNRIESGTCSKTRPFVSTHFFKEHLVYLHTNTNKHRNGSTPEKRTGMVQKSLSPYEQSVIQPVFKNFAEKGVNRVKNNFWDFVPAVLFLYVTVAGGNKIYHEERQSTAVLLEIKMTNQKTRITTWTLRDSVLPNQCPMRWSADRSDRFKY